MKKLMELTIKAWENEDGRMVIETSNESDSFASHKLSKIEKAVLQKVLFANIPISISENPYIIKSDDGYWNFETGWVDVIQDATIFEDQNWILPEGKNVRWSPRNPVLFEIVEETNMTNKGGIKYKVRLLKRRKSMLFPYEWGIDDDITMEPTFGYHEEGARSVYKRLTESEEDLLK